jgi:Zn-dependent protease
VIDFTLSQLVMRIAAVLVVSTLQGWTIAAAAVALGDKGPRHDGRFTIDPLRHVDLLGGAVALIFAVGWSRWVVVDPRALRLGRAGLVLVAAAGFVALLLGVIVLRLARPYILLALSDTAAATAFQLIQTNIEVAVSFAILGLLPLPPLSGGHVLIALLPQWRERLAGMQFFLGLGLAALIATGVAGGVLDPAVRWLMIFLLGEDVGI